MKKIIIILIFLLLTGCNYIELNDMGIVTLMSIKYENNNYNIILEIDENKKDEEKSIYYEASASSIEKAIEEVSLRINKELYFIDLNVILIDQDTVNKKLTQIIDYLTRDVMFGTNFNIVIDNDAKKTIDTIKEKEKIAGDYIKNIFNNSDNIIDIKYYDLLRDFLNPNIDIILPYGKVIKNEYIINEATIFNKDKIITNINLDMIKIYNLLTNKDSNILFQINYQNQDLIFKVSKSKSKIKYDNEILLDINVTGSFIEMESIELENFKISEEIIIVLENKIKEEINLLTNKLIINDSDILKFKKAYFNKKRKEINSISNLKYNTKVKVNLDREGLIFDSIGDIYEKNK